MTKNVGIALGIALAASLPLGCSTGLVSAPKQVSLGNPLAMISLGNQKGATITVALPNQATGFKTQAAQAATANDVSWYKIELVTDSGNPADYATPGPVGAVSYIMGGVNAPGTTGFPGTAVDDANDRMQFVNVAPGTYRARVQAWNRGPDNTYNTGDDKRLNKNGAVNNNPGTAEWAVSTNTATVAFGSSMVTYSVSTQLDVTVDLADEKLDSVDTQLTVNNGLSAPAITGSDI